MEEEVEPPMRTARPPSKLVCVGPHHAHFRGPPIPFRPGRMPQLNRFAIPKYRDCIVLRFIPSLTTPQPSVFALP